METDGLHGICDFVRLHALALDVGLGGDDADIAVLVLVDGVDLGVVASQGVAVGEAFKVLERGATLDAPCARGGVEEVPYAIAGAAGELDPSVVFLVVGHVVLSTTDILGAIQLEWMALDQDAFGFCPLDDGRFLSGDDLSRASFSACAEVRDGCLETLSRNSEGLARRVLEESVVDFMRYHILL